MARTSTPPAPARPRTHPAPARLLSLVKTSLQTSNSVSSSHDVLPWDRRRLACPVTNEALPCHAGETPAVPGEGGRDSPSVEECEPSRRCVRVLPWLVHQLHPRRGNHELTRHLHAHRILNVVSP